LYARIAIDSKTHLHVFNTHLQTTYEQNAPLHELSVLVRFTQLAQLKEFIDQQLKHIPSTERILLLGDFNVNGRLSPDEHQIGMSSAQYNAMLKILTGEGLKLVDIDPKLQEADLITGVLGSEDGDVFCASKTRLIVKDIMQLKYGDHPVTFADVHPQTGEPLETILTHKSTHKTCQSVDYILSIAPEDAADTEATLPILLEECRVEQMLVKGTSFTQLSGNSLFDSWNISPTFYLLDHYGLSVTLKPL
jgi:hypothetical protein